MSALERALQLLTEANETIASERVSPSQSGSSKRKSRPVKRIIHDEEEGQNEVVDLECSVMNASEPLLASIQQQITSYASEDGHREEDGEASSEVLSTGSVEETMEQASIANADLLRKVAEVLSGQQQAQQNNGQQQNQTMSVFDSYMVAAKSLALDPSLLTNGNGLIAHQMSPLIANSTPDSAYTSPERLLQAMLTPSLNFGLGQNALMGATTNNSLLQTPLISPSPSFLHTLMNAQNVVQNGSTTKKQENRPQVVSQALKATKRRLFADDERAGCTNGDDRIEMSDLEAFAQTFKKQRIKFGFTQGDVGVALGKRYGTDFSQTTISRFEALNLSFKNMCKLRPLLKEWLADVEAAIEGGATITDLIEKRASLTSNSGSNHMSELHVTTTAETAHSPIPIAHQNALLAREQNVKRRRKRTNLDLNQRASLDSFFAINPRPDHDRMTEIANTLELDRDVVRVWFCNRRQKMRRVDEPSEGEVATPSVSPLFASGIQLSIEQLQEAAKLATAQMIQDDSDSASGSPEAPSISLDGSSDV